MKIIAIGSALLAFCATSCSGDGAQADAAGRIKHISESTFGVSAEALGYLISGPGAINLSQDSARIYVSRPPVDELIAAGYVEQKHSAGSRVTVLRSKKGDQIHNLFVTRQHAGFADSLEGSEP